MKRKLCFAALLLAVLLAGAFVWYNLLGSGQMATSRWLAHSLEQVKSVQVESGESAFTIVSKGKEWEALIPGADWNIRAKVMRGRFEDFMSKLEDLTPLRTILATEPDSLAEYGLGAGALTFTLQFKENDPDPLRIRLSMGETGKAYGWSSESEDVVYEFDGSNFEQFARTAEYFLDSRVFEFDEDQVKQVQLVQPFGSSWHVKNTPNGYVFLLPGYLKDKEASSSEIKLYVHALALLRAGQLLLEPVATDKDESVLTIRVWAGGHKEPSWVEFYAINDDPKHYLGKSSWLTIPFLLDAESESQLVRSAFDVQGRNVFTLDIGQVASLIIDHGERRYVVVREDSGWRVRGGENDVPGIDMSLWRFTELKFEALPLNNLATTAVKLMHCQLLDQDGDLLREMTFYADPELPQGQCWMKSGDVYYPVSSRLLKDLQGLFPSGAPAGING